MRILVATHNQGKKKELVEAFADLPYEIVTLDDLNIMEDCEETCDTFSGNAMQKAKYYHELSGLPTISDDSGLQVDALNGAPGVYSARWTGEHAGDEANCSKLVEELNKKKVTSSHARYVCAMAYVDNDREFTATGILNGVVKTSQSGTNGFSYDPYFYVKGRSVGDMTLEEKNAISHRAKAIEKLKQKLSEAKK